MTDLVVAQAYVNSLQALYNRLNQNAYANYQNAFSNYVLQLQSAGPQAATPVAPEPPSLTQFDTVKALQIFVAWSDALSKEAPTAPYVLPDFSSAISHFQAAPMTLPTPVVPAMPDDPVGPPKGVLAVSGSGNQAYFTKAGDTLPLGSKITNSRGTFLKDGFATPFGVSTEWEKIG